MFTVIDGIYVRIAIVALLLGIGCFGGCQWQGARDAALIQKKDDALKGSARSLREVSDQLRGFAGTFRRIDAATAENARQAAEAKSKADAEAKEAAKARQAALARATKLERQLALERTGCVDGERPICGVPLR